MDPKSSVPFDVTRMALAVLFISMLIPASFWLARSFLTPFIWADGIDRMIS